VTDAPNQVWVTDVTAIRTLTGWAYLAVILDLVARRVVGWGMSENNDTDLALSAPQHALAARQPSPGLIHHSDRAVRMPPTSTSMSLASRAPCAA